MRSETNLLSRTNPRETTRHTACLAISASSTLCPITMAVLYPSSSPPTAVEKFFTAEKAEAMPAMALPLI